MDSLLLGFIVSCSMLIIFVQFDFDDMCLFLKSLAVLSAASAIVFLIKLLQYFDVLWVFHVALLFGTLYLLPEYVKTYKEGVARRKKIAEHRRKTTVHHFVTQDQGPGLE